MTLFQYTHVTVLCCVSYLLLSIAHYKTTAAVCVDIIACLMTNGSETVASRSSWYCFACVC